MSRAEELPCLQKWQGAGGSAQEVGKMQAARGLDPPTQSYEKKRQDPLTCKMGMSAGGGGVAWWLKLCPGGTARVCVLSYHWVTSDQFLTSLCLRFSCEK